MKKGQSEPSRIFEEYKRGARYKSGIGTRGMYEQSRINERFYCGDQWHGVQAGDSKALVRYNVIRRIGDYKLAMVTGQPVSVVYTAEGVPYTAGMQERVRAYKSAVRDGEGEAQMSPLSPEEEIDLTMDILSDYHKTTAERVKLSDKAALAVRKAYTTGTGVLYTYWDDTVRTGQYADEQRRSPILGDIQCEVLDIENVYFGDTGMDDVQQQPYIIIAQRRSVEELKREAKRNRRPAEEQAAIKADRDTSYMAGDRSQDEPEEEQKATVLTKLYKEYKEDGTYTIMAVRVVEGATVRAAWNTGLRLYPLAKMCWDVLPNSAYGGCEVTHLIPNQLAINKAITSAANAVTMNGMPILLVNRDVIQGEISNDPGQILSVYGAGDMQDAIRYVTPPVFAPQLDNLVNSMISNTLVQSGANEAALGDIKPDNTSAIVAVREAATLPLQLLKNRYYSFIEDTARIWAEFWVTQYGRRRLKLRDEQGEWYAPFNGEKIRDLLIHARVDVGPASLWSEIQSRQTLDNLYQAKVIDVIQYLGRLPRGTIPEQESLVREIKEKMQPPEPSAAPPPTETPTGGGQPRPEDLLAQLPEEYRQKFAALPPEQQQALLSRVAQ